MSEEKVSVVCCPLCGNETMVKLERREPDSTGRALIKGLAHDGLEAEVQSFSLASTCRSCGAILGGLFSIVAAKEKGVSAGGAA
jgi:predicted RNA-binding Zn-ribbon protein involved in translation (DUF1610 family)